MNYTIHAAIVYATEKVVVGHQSDWCATLRHISQELGDGGGVSDQTRRGRDKVSSDVRGFQSISQEQFIDTDKPLTEQRDKWLEYNMSIGGKRIMSEMTLDFIIHFKEGLILATPVPELQRCDEFKAAFSIGNIIWRTFCEYLMFLREETNITTPLRPDGKTYIEVLQYKVNEIKSFMEGVDFPDMFNNEREMQLKC